MRASWQTLHTGLLRSTASLKAKRHFDTAKQRWPEVRYFADVTSLLDQLHTESDDLDGKDRILAAFVTMAQRSQADAEFATSILWLALWPGLDALYRRLWRHFSQEPEELVSAIAENFTVAVQRAKLTRIRRLAATLLRNAERNIRYGHWQVLEEKSRLVELPEDANPAGTDQVSCALAAADPGVSSFGLMRGMNAHEETALIRDRLARFINGHAGLIVTVVIMGASHREVARRLGISESAARKRFQRALSSLRKAFV